MIKDGPGYVKLDTILGWNSNSAQDCEMHEPAHGSISDALMESRPFVGEASGDAIDTGQSFIGCIHHEANEFYAFCCYRTLLHFAFLHDCTEFSCWRYTGSRMQGVHEFFPFRRLNSFYRFHNARVYNADVIAFINDPTCLVISTDVRALVNWYEHFTLKDMQKIFNVHGMSSLRKRNKQLMKRAIIEHMCDRHCLFSIYIFKSLPISRDVQTRET